MTNHEFLSFLGESVANFYFFRKSLLSFFFSRTVINNSDLIFAMLSTQKMCRFIFRNFSTWLTEKKQTVDEETLRQVEMVDSVFGDD